MSWDKDLRKWLAGEGAAPKYTHELLEAEDPTTPPSRLKEIIKSHLNTERHELAAAALRNPSLPGAVWRAYTNISSAWENPSVDLHILEDLRPNLACVLAHLQSVRTGVGVPYSALVRENLQRYADLYWRAGLDNVASVLTEAYRFVNSAHLTKAGVRLSLLLARSFPLNEKQHHVLSRVDTYLEKGWMLSKGDNTEIPHQDVTDVGNIKRALVYGPHRVANQSNASQMLWNYEGALRLHRLLGTQLDLRPFEQGFYERYPTLWVEKD